VAGAARDALDGARWAGVDRHAFRLIGAGSLRARAALVTTPIGARGGGIGYMSAL
jgi:hypothetical protein